MPDAPEFVTIGEVSGSHGVRGEMRVLMLSDFPQRFLALQHVYLSPPPVAQGGRRTTAAPIPPREYQVMSARVLAGGSKRRFPAADEADAARTGPWAGQVHQALIKLAGVNDPETAATLRGYLLQLPGTEAWPLPPDSFYAFQIYDLPVRTPDGRTLGVIEDLLATGSNDVYVVRTPQGKELLVPAVKDIVLEINPAAGYVEIRDPAEWSDDEA
ncbi:MAG TPA: ribosome maturation factor RimM [Chloroflexia bacterium]|nr:ribosome maturation factor RimM [Chloroflexia bacterium]